MIKTLIASGVAVSAAVLGSPAIAETYVNIENNAGFAGGDGLDMDFVGSVTDLHIGYEGGGEFSSYYMQAGPALIAPDGGSADVEASGKIGGSVFVDNDKKVSVYGEISFMTVDDFDAVDLGTKIGAKWAF